MTYVKIKETLYPATVSGKMTDREWDSRESKAITLEGTYSSVDALFQDGTSWSIVMIDTVPETDGEGEPILDGDGEPMMTEVRTEFDNSDFSVRGDMIVHMDGSCTVKMGKESEMERLEREGAEEFEAAYRDGVNSI